LKITNCWRGGRPEGREGRDRGEGGWIIVITMPEALNYVERPQAKKPTWRLYSIYYSLNLLQNCLISVLKIGEKVYAMWLLYQNKNFSYCNVDCSGERPTCVPKSSGF
jgi:hypothetical protein